MSAIHPSIRIGLISNSESDMKQVTKGEVRTTEGLDLIESKFRIIAKEPLSKYSLTNVHYALLAAGFSYVDDLSNSGLSWNAKNVDCTHAMFYFKDNYIGFNYKNKINWYQTPGANIVDAAFAVSGRGIIFTDDDGKLVFISLQV